MRRRVDIISVNREKNYVYVVSHSPHPYEHEYINDQWNLADFESKLGVTFVKPEYDFMSMFINFDPLPSRC